MKTLLIILISLSFLISCSHFGMDKNEIQLKYLKTTPLGTDLNTVLKKHKTELNNNKHWSHYTKGGCQNQYKPNVRTKGSIIRGRVGVRFILEQIFIKYCFNEYDKLVALYINIEIDGI